VREIIDQLLGQGLQMQGSLVPGHRGHPRR
jgi:hypothetical protein